MKKILLLFLIFLNSCTSANTSQDPFKKHFKKPYTILWGETVRIAASSNKGIAYWFDRRYVENYEVKSHATEYCKNLNKKVGDGEYVYYQRGHASAFFKCLNY
tara:strand:- start:25 stop:333 length:309 start_codon:yes stop_codon:yes gene_type:complete